MLLNEQIDIEYGGLTSQVLGCCFEVMNELGSGYLEAVYKNSLFLALKDKGLSVEVEKQFEIKFRNRRVGFYQSDIIVNGLVLVELKSCKTLLLEHKAQVINYLTGIGLPIGILVNFANRNLEYKRLYNSNFQFVKYPAASLKS